MSAVKARTPLAPCLVAQRAVITSTSTQMAFLHIYPLAFPLVVILPALFRPGLPPLLSSIVVLRGCRSGTGIVARVVRAMYLESSIVPGTCSLEGVAVEYRARPRVTSLSQHPILQSAPYRKTPVKYPSSLLSKIDGAPLRVLLLLWLTLCTNPSTILQRSCSCTYSARLQHG